MELKLLKLEHPESAKPIFFGGVTIKEVQERFERVLKSSDFKHDVRSFPITFFAESASDPSPMKAFSNLIEGNVYLNHHFQSNEDADGIPCCGVLFRDDKMFPLPLPEEEKLPQDSESGNWNAMMIIALPTSKSEKISVWYVKYMPTHP